MRHKRLKHIAKTLLDIFSGWRLINSYQNLALLGSGVLEIDALNLSCRFNEAAIEPIPIAHELHLWVSHELDQHQIDRNKLEAVLLFVKMAVRRVPIYAGREDYLLVADLRSVIRTDEAAYESSCIHRDQWPVGWPET